MKKIIVIMMMVMMGCSYKTCPTYSYKDMKRDSTYNYTPKSYLYAHLTNVRKDGGCK